MKTWDFEHTIFTKAPKKTAWDFMTDMSNQVRMEPGVENIELDGPFATGTIGRTITRDYTQEWELSEVIQEERFVITGHDDQALSLSFCWEFKDEGTGTRLTQQIKARGPQIEGYLEIFKGMEESAPRRMTILAEELDQINTNDHGLTPFE